MCLKYLFTHGNTYISAILPRNGLKKKIKYSTHRDRVLIPGKSGAQIQHKQILVKAGT